MTHYLKILAAILLTILVALIVYGLAAAVFTTVRDTIRKNRK